MTYVYEKEGRVVYCRDTQPEADRVIELDRMIPEPVRAGFDPILRADFATGRVWFDLVENSEGVRARKLAAITVHDCSPEVNSFMIGGASMWLDRDTRVSLSRTIGIEAAAGALTTTIWYNDALPPVRFDLPIEAAQAMLSALEIYAKECFNATQAHRAAVYALDTTYQIEAYDHTAGYPEKLTFNLS